MTEKWATVPGFEGIYEVSNLGRVRSLDRRVWSARGFMAAIRGRGIVPWHKPGAFPQSGRFAHSCEYVIWGTNGARSYGDHGFALPGFFEGRAPRDREHMTQKPLDVMRELCAIVPKRGTIFDPFAGSGTTGVAAVMNGCNFIGVEITEHYAEVAANRLRTLERGYRDDGEQGALDIEGGVA